MKPLPLICAVVFVVSLFVAYDQYQSNAAAVQAMNNMGGSMLSNFGGGGKLEPATPAATKYALLVSVIAAVLGVVFHQQSKDQSRA